MVQSGTVAGEWVENNELGPDQYPSGLASTGVSSVLGSALAIGVLLLIGGALLLVTLRSRKSRKP